MTPLDHKPRSLTQSTHRQHIVNTSPTHRQHIANTSPTHRQHIVNTSPTHRQHIVNTSSTHRQHIANTSSTHRQHPQPPYLLTLLKILCLYRIDSTNLISTGLNPRWANSFLTESLLCRSKHSNNSNHNFVITTVIIRTNLILEI